MRYLCYSSVCLLYFFFVLSACRDKDDKLAPVSVLDSSPIEYQPTALDQWIKSHFTIPYGIEIVYRWDRSNIPVFGQGYPCDPNKVKSLLTTLNDLWLELYEDDNLGGKGWLRGKMPIKLYLIGSKALDRNGVTLLAPPDAIGDEMYIYDVNQFDPPDNEKVFTLMRSVHHQYALKLAEITQFDWDSFSAVSALDYRSTTDFMSNFNKEGDNFFKISPYAYREGFYTYHAMISFKEDFAEIVSCYLTHSPVDINDAKKKSGIAFLDEEDDDEDYIKEQQENARKAFRNLDLKDKLVVEHFKKRVRLSLTSLQRISLTKINALKKVDPKHDTTNE